MKDYILEGIAVFWQCILLGIVLFAIYQFMLIATRKRKRLDYGKFNIPQLFCELLLAVYICTILQITGIIGRTYTWNLSGAALQNLTNIPFEGASIKMVTLNCLLFVPYGFLAAVLKRRSDTPWWKLLFVGLATSFMIELIQAFTGRLPEWDDLIANTAGFLVGLFIARGILELRHKELRGKGLLKIFLTVVVFGALIFALSFWANGDKLQEQEDAYYERYSFNTENYSQISKFTIWKNGKHKTIGKEAAEAEEWYSWFGDDISNHAAHYKIKDFQSDVRSIPDKDKVYIEIEYSKPQNFKFYNNKSWEMKQLRSLLLCVDNGMLWYGTENGKIEKCARYEDKENEYEANTQLMDELNEWMNTK
jgi:glycopeptide antibiotics resistance protein